MLKNNYIIESTYCLKGDFKISPFSTDDIRINNLILEKKVNIEVEKNKFCNYFKNLLTEDQEYIITQSGRNAIKAVLETLNLKRNDEVAILTPTNNFYISGCVTKEIEKFCGWSREITTKTKVLFVNHEFGVCYEDLEKLKKYNLPIIEDCAYSFASNNSFKTKGLIGDFVIYSFPKYFPIQAGGLLKYKKKYKVNPELDKNSEDYIKIIVGHYIKNVDKWAKKRINNYLYLEKKMENLGFKSRFELKEGVVPGVYMFKNLKNIDLDKLKIYLGNLGIECSVFYGENTFFIPVNHRLEKEELDYFIEVIKTFGVL